jgi:hypothetical protein
MKELLEKASADYDHSLWKAVMQNKMSRQTEDIVGWINTRLPKPANWRTYVSTAYGDGLNVIAERGQFRTSWMIDTRKPDPNPPTDVAMLDFMGLDKVQLVARSKEELLHEAAEFVNSEVKFYDAWMIKREIIKGLSPKESCQDDSAAIPVTGPKLPPQP